MPQDDDHGSDDYGFWDGDRDRSATGPIPRLPRNGSIGRSRPATPPNYLLRRVAVAAAFTVVAVPVAMSMGDSGKDTTQISAGPSPSVSESAIATVAAPASPVTQAMDPALAAGSPVEPASVGQAATVAGGVDPATTAVPAVAVVPVPVGGVAAPSVAPLPSSSTPPRAETEVTVSAAPAPTVQQTAPPATNSSPTEPPTTEKQPCAIEYEVVPGDYWILIADKVSVRLSEALNANDATVDTPLYPGRAICLPADASPPTTERVPTTTAKPTPTTSAPSTSAATKPAVTKPAATAAPATTAPSTIPVPPPNNYSKTQVQQIIRDVWPDELEDEAIRIATRESNLIPTVRNSCCLGLFQLYWKVHKGWMTSAGVTSSDQLYDPTVNAYMAYAMYLRAGGWGPWL